MTWESGERKRRGNSEKSSSYEAIKNAREREKKKEASLLLLTQYPHGQEAQKSNLKRPWVKE